MLEIEKLINNYYEYKGKADAELENIGKEISRHSHVFPNTFTVTDWGDGADNIAVFSEYLCEQDDTWSHIIISDVINAIKTGTVIDEKWINESKK
jgi:hypothetical protein